jgi:integrase
MEMTLVSFNVRRLDADPTYSPGLRWDGPTPWWRPTAADIKAGYKIKAFNLTGLPEEDRSAKCRALTRELLQWRTGQVKVLPFTWAWAIKRYLSDDLSPMNEVKENTRAGYIEQMNGWLASKTFADTMIADTTFEVMMRWKKAMVASERSVAYIHRRFAHLRLVARYGMAIAPKLFTPVCAVLSSGQLKVRTPKPRTVYATPDQVAAIIAAADKAGASAFALGLSLQWWLTLRAVDVRGQWLGKGKARRWADGLTWDMVDLDAKTITKMVSKTERHDSRPMEWDLSPLPDLMARLSAIPREERIGPVIKKDGKPIEVRLYRDLWQKFAKVAGVPPEVQMRDVRAGAINDAMAHGADRLQMQHAANHKDGATTERYIRARDTGANKVIQMRTGTNANNRDAG